MKKIHTYGCSFSFPFWINEEESFTHLLAKYMGCEYNNRSFPALCHNEIFHRLLSDINTFKKDDLIIYQFTAGNREGFMVNNSFYYSSAGIGETLEDTVRVMNQWGGGREKYPFTDDKILSLMSFVNDWSKETLFYKFNRVNDTLKFLEKTIGIRYVYLFLDDNFHEFIDNDKTVTFLLPSNEYTPSIMRWATESKITLSDSRNDVDPQDKHPNHIAHKLLSDLISLKINKNKLI